MMFGTDEGELASGVRALIGEEFDSKALHKFIDSPDLRLASLDATAREIGCFALVLPERLDGLGLGLADMAPIYAVLGAFMPPLPLFSTALASDLLAMAGADAWLGKIATGATVAVVLPPWQAQPSLADGRCSGALPFVLDGADADLFLFRVGGAGGDAWILCPRDAAGVTVTPLPLVDETRNAASVELRDVAVPGDSVIASGEDCARFDRRVTVHAALAIAADCVGGGQAILAKTLDYLRVREQFSRPIGSFQALKHRAANLHLKLTVAQSFLEEAVTALAADTDDAAELAMLACAHAADGYAAIAEDTLQLHGGIGFTREHDAHIYLKRAKLNQALLGGPDRLRDAAAERLLAPAA